MLSPGQIERFRRDGFVVVRAAVPTPVVAACRQEIWRRLGAQGPDRLDRSTWQEPLVRMTCPEGGPFVAAGRAPGLRQAYDQLIGPRAWVRTRGVGGTVPVRFPVRGRPVDAVWHLDGGWAADRLPWINVHSRGRGLLALFLLNRTGSDDAPTALVVGSHLDVARTLAPAGHAGRVMWDVVADLPRSTFRRPKALATGRAGDVYLCHPFLLHATSWPNRGTRPRLLIQPNIALHRSFPLDGRRSTRPVERAILDALGR